jgi:hypothetical protein
MHLPAHPITRARPPSDAVRWLAGPADEAQVIALLRACYEDSYTWGALYEPGTLCALWASGRLASLGDVAADGRLVGHTGLWFKDAAGDAAESGLSLMHPDARARAERTGEHAIWAWLLAELAHHAAVLHQHATTLHLAAQLYAINHMRAALGGVIPCYVEGERVVGLDERGAVMHALSMTTWLKPCPQPELLIPDGPHVGWLGELARSLGLRPSALAWEDEVGGGAIALMERVEGLDLTRRRVTAGAGALAATDARVDLVHLPATAQDITALTGTLYAAGYLPVAIRPGARRAHEIIWWRGQPPDGMVTQMKLASVAWKDMIRGWSACSAPQR